MKRKEYAMKRKEGFTLIELLIVISIIALLMAVLLPALSRAREQAKRAVCGNNLKQIGVAMIGYTGDYDDALPWYGNPPNKPDKDDLHPYAAFRCKHAPNDNYYQNGTSGCPAGDGGRPIPMKLGCLWARGYIGDGKVFYCPSNRDPQYRYESYTKPDPAYSGLSSAWGMPHQAYNLSATPTHNDWIRIGLTYYPIDESFKEPPFLIPMGGGYVPMRSARRYSLLSKKAPYLTDLILTRKDISHKSGIDNGTNRVKNAGVNALFKDGHVRYVGDESVVVGAAQKKQKMFDNDFWNLWDPPGSLDPPDDIDARYIFYNIFMLIKP
jgi:prepilin-type N-terminal cleavage/methylation domain-containing protein